MKRWALGVLAAMMMIAAVPHAALAADDDSMVQDKQQAAQMQKELDGLNSKLKDAMAQQKQMEDEIAAALQKSAELKNEIADTQKNLDEQRKKLGDRMKVMYETGDASFWEVLLGASDFSDFIDRFTALTMVMGEDQKLIDQYKADQQKLQQDQAKLEDEQNSRKEKQAQLAALQTSLESQVKSTSSSLAAKQQEVAADEQAAMDAYKQYQAAAAASSSSGTGASSAAAGSSAGAASSASSEPVTVSGGGYAWPVPSSHNITSGYGFRSGGEFHKGIDIGAPVGTPIVAVADGVVLQAGPASGYGHWVVILHAGNKISIYGHMFADGVKVSAGQHVTQGQVIALSGNDGESTGPHLHFSFASGSSAGSMSYLNPMAYLQ